jgi:UDP-N-acetylmuramate: L-alanyl-gamma-D-glutamyl-meso-diaminopimelate ligase
LQLADRVLLADVYRKEQLEDTACLSPATIVETLQQRGIPAWFYATTEAIIAHICRDAQPTDVILIMSNGGFDNIHQRVLTALAQRDGATTPATSSHSSDLAAH